MSENENFEGFQQLNKTRKWKFLIISFIVLVVVGVGLFIGYNKLTKEPALVYKMAINNVYDYLKDYIKGNTSDFTIDMLNEPFTFDAQVKFKSNEPELQELEKISYDLSLGMDNVKKQASASLALNNENSELFKITAALMAKNVYISSDEIFAQVIKVGEYDLFKILEESKLEDKLSNREILTEETLKEALKELKNILINSLQKDNLQINSTTITVDGKRIKANKISYILNKEDLETLYKNILTEISNSSEILDVLANITGKAKNDLREYIDSLIKNMDIETDKLVIEIYTNLWNKVVETDLYIDGEKVLSSNKNEDNLNITLWEDEGKIVITIKENEALLTIYNGNEEEGNILYTNKDGVINIEINSNSDGSRVQVNLELKAIDSSARKISMDFKLGIVVKEQSEKYDLTMEGKMSLAKSEVEVLNTTDSINIEDLSQKDEVKIRENIEKLLEKFNLANSFGEIL